MALTVFSLAVGMGGLVVGSTQGAYAAVRTRVTAGVEARQRTDRIAEELATIGTSNLYPLPTADWGSSHLYYRQVEDIKDGEPIWGAQSAIYLTYEDGEANDGLDNNGNGLVDECRVVLARNLYTSDQTLITLMSGVSEYAQDEHANGYDDNGNGLRDERGLSFHLKGEVMTVRVSTVELDAQGGTVQHTAERSFRLMN